MNTYIVNLSVPYTGGPHYEYMVEASSEEAAVDVAFDLAFSDYPQFGSFQIDGVERAA